MDIYNKIRDSLRQHAVQLGILDNNVIVRGRPLLPEEAIGSPEHDDYPLVKGREVMLEVEVAGAIGQAFTDSKGHYEGTVKDVLELPLCDSFERTLLIATLNAVLRKADVIEKTRHCKNDELVECAQQLVTHIANSYGSPRVLLVGLQPRMLEYLSKSFETRVLDLDFDNIGKKKFGITIESGDHTENAMAWCDLMLITGSVFTNATYPLFMYSEKPKIFFGVTVGGPAHVLGLERFCACGH